MGVTALNGVYAGILPSLDTLDRQFGEVDARTSPQATSAKGMHGSTTWRTTMADVDPYRCPDSRTGRHRWLRSAITDRAKFCFYCGVRASDVVEVAERA